MTSQTPLCALVVCEGTGLALHKTLQGLKAAEQALTAEALALEPVVILLTEDAIALDYLKRNPLMFSLEVVEAFGKPVGHAINDALSEVRSDTVYLIRGGDVVTKAWLLSSYQRVRQVNPQVVLHPEYVISFGAESFCRHQVDFHEKPSALTAALTSVLWVPATCCSKSLLQEQGNRGGATFGEWHWYWTVDTLTQDIAHEVVAETTLFCRFTGQSKEELLQSPRGSLGVDLSSTLSALTSTVQVDALDSVPRYSSNMPRQLPSPAGKTRRIAGRIKRRFKRFLTAQSSVHARERQLVPLPKWLLQSWRQANLVDNLIVPPRGGACPSSLFLGGEATDALRRALLDLVQQCTRQPDMIFCVPYMIMGGAERVAINYLCAVQKLKPEWHVALITTVPANNVWQDRVPAGVDFIDFGNLAAALDEADRLRLFSRLLELLACKRLHLINSAFGYKWIANNLAVLQTQNYDITASLFCYDVDLEGNRWSFGDNGFLTQALPAIRLIATDNRSYANEAVFSFGYNPTQITVHYQPLDSTVSTAVAASALSTKDTKMRLLWASRIVPAKRPDVLKAIAQRLDPLLYGIDVAGTIEGYPQNYFDDCPVIRLVGNINFNSFPLQNYHAFLYTAAIDGIPNVIMEMVMRGLPLIASNDGGVGEVVMNDQTGYLVEIEDIDGYVSAIERVRQSPLEAARYVEEARKLLKERHSWECFYEAVERDLL